MNYYKFQIMNFKLNYDPNPSRFVFLQMTEFDGYKTFLCELKLKKTVINCKKVFNSYKNDFKT